MKDFNYTTHSVRVGSSEYWVQGSDTEFLIELANKWGMKYDSIKPSKLPASQRIIRVWAIGELHDYLKSKQK